MNGGDGCSTMGCTVYLTIVKMVNFMSYVFYHNKNF